MDGPTSRGGASRGAPLGPGALSGQWELDQSQEHLHTELGNSQPELGKQEGPPLTSTPGKETPRPSLCFHRLALSTHHLPCAALGTERGCQDGQQPPLEELEGPRANQSTHTWEANHYPSSPPETQTPPEGRCPEPCPHPPQGRMAEMTKTFRSSIRTLVAPALELLRTPGRP